MADVRLPESVEKALVEGTTVHAHLNEVLEPVPCTSAECSSTQAARMALRRTIAAELKRERANALQWCCPVSNAYAVLQLRTQAAALEAGEK